MIPIIWRFFIKEYLKVFILSLFSFITLLLVTRFDDIARLATFGSPLKNVVLFTLYQIPYILPIAIPLSSLLSAFLFLNRISQSHEFSAFLASGFSFFSLLLPLLTISSFVAIGNFYFLSEVATRAHLTGRKMLYELTTQNPLILLQKGSLPALKGTYVQFSPEHNGKEAKDLLIAWTNLEESSINVALAKKIKIAENQLTGKNLTIISSYLGDKKNFLMVENQEEMNTSSFECAQFLYTKNFKIATDHLCFSLLEWRLKNLKNDFSIHPEKDELKKLINKCRSEFLRRYSLGFSPISFMLLGATLAMRYTRKTSRKNIFLVALLAAMGLIFFLIGKEFHSHFFLSSFFFIMPHVLFISLSLYIIYKLKRGRV